MFAGSILPGKPSSQTAVCTKPTVAAPPSGGRPFRPNPAPHARQIQSRHQQPDAIHHRSPPTPSKPNPIQNTGMQAPGRTPQRTTPLEQRA
ncbi:MAG: hypothetical protein H6656_02700 [Ardenticatenaceae bacterium]|nr:hypothetical protein [Ardenticatenaceae bacterium]